MPLRSWRLGIPALEANQSFLLDIFCKRNVRLSIFGRPQIQSKEEHLIWCRDNTEAKCIGDFQIIYDNNGVCCGSHSVTYSSGKFGLVMFFGLYSNAGVTRWTSLVSRDGD